MTNKDNWSVKHLCHELGDGMMLDVETGVKFARAEWDKARGHVDVGVSELPDDGRVMVNTIAHDLPASTPSSLITSARPAVATADPDILDRKVAAKGRADATAKPLEIGVDVPNWPNDMEHDRAAAQMEVHDPLGTTADSLTDGPPPEPEVPDLVPPEPVDVPSSPENPDLDHPADVPPPPPSEPTIVDSGPVTLQATTAAEDAAREQSEA